MMEIQNLYNELITKYDLQLLCIEKFPLKISEKETPKKLNGMKIVVHPKFGKPVLYTPCGKGKLLDSSPKTDSKKYKVIPGEGKGKDSTFFLSGHDSDSLKDSCDFFYVKKDRYFFDINTNKDKYGTPTSLLKYKHFLQSLESKVKLIPELFLSTKSSITPRQQSFKCKFYTINDWCILLCTTSTNNSPTPEMEKREATEKRLKFWIYRSTDDLYLIYKDIFKYLPEFNLGREIDIVSCSLNIKLYSINFEKRSFSLVHKRKYIGDDRWKYKIVRVKLGL
jgi:hypothetical protein